MIPDKSDSDSNALKLLQVGGWVLMIMAAGFAYIGYVINESRLEVATWLSPALLGIAIGCAVLGTCAWRIKDLE